MKCKEVFSDEAKDTGRPSYFCISAAEGNKTSRVDEEVEDCVKTRHHLVIQVTFHRVAKSHA